MERLYLYQLTNYNKILIQRNNLLKQNKYVDVVDEVLVKLKNKMKVNKHDLGLIINSLYESRTAMVNENKDTEAMDYFLLKLIKIHDTL